jgi:carbon-monoxide dehydrogenase medium subunit
MMKLRLASPALLVDLAEVPDLRGVRRDGERIRIGALTTHATLAADPVLRTLAPALSDAAAQLGDPQVRNRGTIGGACAHADPVADYPAVMLALDAVFEVCGADGTRCIAADDFFRGMFEVALSTDEVLTALSFDGAPRSAYVKFPHPASGYAVVGVAVALQLSADAIASARVAVTGVGDAHYRARGVEAALAGVVRDDGAALTAACAPAAEGIDARSDRYASAEYRAAMSRVFTERAVAQALTR